MRQFCLQVPIQPINTFQCQFNIQEQIRLHFYSLNFQYKIQCSRLSDFTQSGVQDWQLMMFVWAGTTGIESSGLRENNFSLYPNPAAIWLTLIPKYQGEVNFKFFDAFGKVVASGILSQGIQTISVSSLDAGIYSMDLNCTGKSVQSRFVVIKKSDNTKIFFTERSGCKIHLIW